MHQDFEELMRRMDVLIENYSWAMPHLRTIKSVVAKPRP